MIHRTAVLMGVSVVVSHKQLVVELCLQCSKICCCKNIQVVDGGYKNESYEN